MEIWEQTFLKKQKMWGDKITSSAYLALDDFKNRNINKILIPGVGYGRNAKLFIDNNFIVDGIEISKTALDIANELNFNNLYLGNVSQMPFNSIKYDGIYSHALIHLLSESERSTFLKNVFDSLNDNGLFIFTTVFKNEIQTKNTIQIGENNFKNNAGINIYMYDEDSIKNDLSDFKNVTIKLINEDEDEENNNGRKFFYVTATK